MNSDIKKVRREKNRLQRLENSIAKWRTLLTWDIRAKEHIRNAIEELHKAEFELIKRDF